MYLFIEQMVMWRFFHTPSVANGDHQETGIGVILILSLTHAIF